MTSTTIASDFCGNVTITQSPAASSNASLGNTTVTITATDKSGNVVTCNSMISIRDIFPPSISTCTNTLSIQVDQICSAVVPQVDVQASDICGVSSTQQVPAVGTFVNVGSSIITTRVIDTS